MASPTIRISEKPTRNGRYLRIILMGSLYDEFGPDPDPQYVIERAYALADKYHTPRERVKIPENLKP